MQPTLKWITLLVIAVLALANVAARPQATTLRGTVYNDANKNGKLDAGETGLVDIRVEVSTPDQSFVQEYRTGSDGTYGPVLSEGSFNVRILPPEGWSVTTRDSYSVFLQHGTAVLGLDFGLVQGAAPSKPAASSPGAPGTLPVTGGEQAEDVSADLWSALGLWLVVGGAAFIGLTSLAPRVRRK
ncbi:MAG TPA: SdrD B-like domain-containing protein [Anaerolineae bacterium]|nr:SdrD B-like domain-containing protein [Anaerolineae bacterium]